MQASIVRALRRLPGALSLDSMIAVAKPMFLAAATRTYASETSAVATAGGVCGGRELMAGVQNAASALMWRLSANVLTLPAVEHETRQLLDESM